MLKINKNFKLPLIITCVVFGGIFLFQYLTFIPEYSHAESISTENPERTLMDITYMQEMTPEVCARSIESTSSTGGTYQKQLIDSRDGKKYWVAKLKDGNCWMTQNLDLDIPKSGLNAEDTNIITDWIPKDGEETQTGASPSGFAGANPIKSWDPGYVAYIYNENTKQVTVEKLSNNPNNEKSHYLVGNYYTWGAAMAGSADSGKDICPKSWQLPLSNSGTSSKTFQALTNVLGATSDTNTGASDLRLLTSPAYFVYGGDVRNTLLDSAAVSGNYWSSVPIGDDSAYQLIFYGASVRPSNGGNRYHGYSVRCVNSDRKMPTPGSGINDPTLSVTIPNIITLSLSSEVVDIDTSVSNPAEGNFTTTVTSNSKYNLALSATAPEGQTPHTDLKNEDPNKTTSIPALSSTNPIVTEADESWWGIKCTNPTDSTNCTKTAYTGLTLNPDTYFTSTTSTPTTGTETPFTIGIKVSPNLPSGTYSTSIQVTASSTGSN